MKKLTIATVVAFLLSAGMAFAEDGLTPGKAPVVQQAWLQLQHLWTSILSLF